MSEPVLKVLANGTKEWFIDGKFHRIDGPAIEWSNGTKQWWLDGRRHRIDGPAFEWANNNNKQWWLDGIQLPDAGTYWLIALQLQQEGSKDE